MDVYFSFIDWPEAESRAVNGTFAAEVVDDSSDQKWMQAADFTDVLEVLFGVGAAIQAILPHCSEGNRDLLERSLGQILAEEPQQHNELPAELDAETFWLALGPSTVSGICSAAESIDFQEVQDQYANHCPQDVQDDLGYSADEFVEHLQSWCDLFNQAASTGRGLLATVG
jgi:hypothetical protein